MKELSEIPIEIPIKGDPDVLKNFLDKFEPAKDNKPLRTVEKLINQLCSKSYLVTTQQIGDLIHYLNTIQFCPNNSKCRSRANGYIQSVISYNDKSAKKTKEIFLKYLLPAIYEFNKEKPLHQVLCFLQPRQGLNQSFRYLYNYLEKTYPWELTLVELHRDFVSLEEYYTYAAYFVRDMATYPVVFVHESNNLMGHLDIRKETQIIQLWHGCGVFKKIGLSTAGKKGFKTMETQIEYPEYNKYSLVTIASPELSWVFEEFMGIPKESGIIQPLGVSRTDEFFDPVYRENCFKELYHVIPSAKNKKVILYAPTYRGVGSKRFSPDALDIPFLADQLGEDYILIVKHHQTAKEVPEIPEPYRNSFAYDLTKGSGMDINMLMTIADICITDYSSVAFEFSLFCRPLLFFVFDLDKYIDNRGLYYNFEEITPGPLCRTNEELVQNIRELADGFDDTEITEFRDRFMSSCDGHSTERLIRYLVEKFLPVPDDFSSFHNPQFMDKKFAGWNCYRIEDGAKVWLTVENDWRKEDSETGSLKRKLLDTKDSIQRSVELEPAGFYIPVWKDSGFYLKVKKRLFYIETILKKVLDYFPKIE